MWDDQFATFAKHYTVVRYDVRGFGKSALPTGESYSRADDLKGLLDYLDMPQASIIGLSMGGSIAIDFSIEYQQSSGCLVLVD
jgi:pimeloyl-ACP methyl ester carboxylesterase